MKNVADIYALAPLQQLMLAQALSGRDAGLLVEQFRCTLRGQLDATRLGAACRTVVERHEMLRTAFAWEKLKQPVQIVRERAEPSWIELDWRDLPPEEQAGRLAELQAADRRRGFDLTKAPLVRFHLIRRGEDEWQFLWTCHHLITDGWSAAIVLRDLFSIYEALRLGRSPDLAPPGRYADYLKWLGRQSTDEVERYWSQYLQGAGRPRAFPQERQLSATARDEAPREETRRLTSELTLRLNQLAGQNRVSASALVEAAWGILVAHHTGSSDLVFGIATAGRPPQVPAIENLVAALVNNLPLRMRIDWDDALPEVLARLQRTQVELQRFEHTPLPAIAAAAGLPLGARLFDSLVVVENYPLGTSGRMPLGELVIEDFAGTATSAYPLTLIVIPSSEIELRLLASPRHFSDRGAERLFDQLIALLDELVDKPQARLRELPLVDSAEQARLVGNGQREGYLVVDACGRPSPIGLPGAIWTVGENRRATGYRGVLDDDGNIGWLGRADTGVVIDHYGVDPREITAVLALHPFIDSAIVLPRTDHEGQTHLAAYIVPSTDARTALESGQHGLLLEQLRSFLAARIPEPMVPRIWRTLAALPRDARGEIDVDRLPEAFRQRPDMQRRYRPPQDPIEACLCSLWSELLGVEPVGVEDDFVELGGHSSLAVALAARVEEAFGRRLPLAALYEKRTIVELAELLRHTSSTSPTSSLVPIRPTGNRPPLFCIHPAGGTVLCYFELARHLDADLPVYGLEAQGLDGLSPPLASVEEMARAYVAEMRRVQETGPYHVCGWSTGGIIAFEIARQLASSGHEVPLVALFDSAIPRPGEEFDESDLIALLGMLFPDEDLTAVGQLDRQQQLEIFQQRAERAQLLLAGASSSQAGRIYEVFQANMKAVVEHSPGPLEQRLTLIRAAGQATPMHADPMLGWESWAKGGIDLFDVSSSHLAMFASPGVDEVATILNACLAAHPLVADTPA